MKLADIPPTYCAACFCSEPAKPHVDFEAIYDGPVIENSGVKIPIDDLVLCEDCLAAGAILIGMVHNKKMMVENYELGKAIEEKDEYITALETVVRDLEHTLGVAILGNVRKRQGRPTIRIPESLKDIEVVKSNGEIVKVS